MNSFPPDKSLTESYHVELKCMFPPLKVYSILAYAATNSCHRTLICVCTVQVQFIMCKHLQSIKHRL